MGNNNYSTLVVKNPTTGELETVCLDTGEVLTNNVDLSKYRFNIDMALLICQKIREGGTLKKLHEDSNFPNATVINYWRRNNVQFDEEIKQARKERAEHYHDKVIELADETVDKDDVPVAKFRSDVYKWAAEKGDPSSYGAKIEHTGSNVAPAIVVVTGIKRAALEEPEDVEFTEIKTDETIDDQETESNGSEQPRPVEPAKQ